MAAWGYEFYLLQHSKIKFVSPRGHEISSIYLPVNYSHLMKVIQTLKQLPDNGCNKNFSHTIWETTFQHISTGPCVTMHNNIV